MLVLKVLGALFISMVTLVACCTYHPSFGTPWSEVVVSNPDLKEDRASFNSFSDPETLYKVTDQSKVEELRTFLEGYPFGWWPPLPESPGAGYFVDLRTAQGKMAWLAISRPDSKYIWISWQAGGDYFDYDSARMHSISPEAYARLREILDLHPRPTLF